MERTRQSDYYAPVGSDPVDLIEFASLALINMANRPERLQESLSELGAVAGREVQAGVDVHLIRPKQFDDAGGFTNPAFRSNLDAHLQAARWAKETGADRVLVLEDDVSFGSDWLRHGPRLLTELAGREWHMANIGYLDVWNEAAQAGADSAAGWVRFTGRVNGAHAYLINHTGYDRWNEHLEVIATGTTGDDLRGPMSSDGAMNTFSWVDADVIRLLAVPNMVGTRPTKSDITPSQVDRFPVIGDAAERLRAWRRRRYGSTVANYK